MVLVEGKLETVPNHEKAIQTQTTNWRDSDGLASHLVDFGVAGLLVLGRSKELRS